MKTDTNTNIAIVRRYFDAVARGDLATVRRHLEALGIAAPDLLDAYRAMARRVVVVALAKGSIDAPTATAVLGVLGAPARSEPPSE